MFCLWDSSIVHLKFFAWVRNDCFQLQCSIRILIIVHFRIWDYFVQLNVMYNFENPPNSVQYRLSRRTIVLSRVKIANFLFVECKRPTFRNSFVTLEHWYIRSKRKTERLWRMFKKIFSEIGGTVAKNVNNNVILRLDVLFFVAFYFRSFFSICYVFLSVLRCAIKMWTVCNMQTFYWMLLHKYFHCNWPVPFSRVFGCIS